MGELKKIATVKVENTLSADIFNWELCNKCKDEYGKSRDGERLCDFCEKSEYGNYYYCRLFGGEALYSHDKWIKRCNKCLTQTGYEEPTEVGQ